MPRYLLRIQYDGADFFGWQRQNEGKTVQGTIEHGLSTILQAPIAIHGSGRTDSGVHAEHQAAHFDYGGSFTKKRMLRRINSIMPDSIAIDSITEVPDDFHSRFDAIYRQYRYQITLRSRPLLRHQSWCIHDEPDLASLQRCLNIIQGIHSFENFAKATPGLKHMRCEIIQTEFEMPTKDQIHIHIRANRFLRHMVRFLVGSMIHVATGKLELEQFEAMLNNPRTPQKNITAPAKGLILEAVIYP
ncbi:MAG: tRNA pseudouridine(38-40) synthase TruA [Balneolales bacterium]